MGSLTWRASLWTDSSHAYSRATDEGLENEELPSVGDWHTKFLVSLANCSMRVGSELRGQINWRTGFAQPGWVSRSARSTCGSRRPGATVVPLFPIAAPACMGRAAREWGAPAFQRRPREEAQRPDSSPRCSMRLGMMATRETPVMAAHSNPPSHPHPLIGGHGARDASTPTPSP